MSIEAVADAFGSDGQSVAAGPALDLVVAELDPLAVSLLIVGGDGAIDCRDARSAVAVGDPRRELGNWHAQVGARAPLTPATLAGVGRPVVTFADLGDAGSLLRDDAELLAAYRRIGAIDDTRVLIRDGRRLVAMLAVWRPLQSVPWREEELRRLEALQPLIELAWLAAPRPAPPLELPPDADLTPRQARSPRSSPAAPPTRRWHARSGSAATR